MILDSLVSSTKKRVEEAKKHISPDAMEALAFDVYQKEDSEQNRFPFEQALRQPEIAFICEVKKASPSKGLIAPDFPYLKIAREYESAGANAISVLTEPEYFLGKNEYLTQIRREVNLPLLRKDFTVDPYQIFEAKVIGASAILLICALLDIKTLTSAIRLCDSLGLSALVEAHDEEEVRLAIQAGSRIIGVNNRNLKTFEVDVSNSIRLRRLIPSSLLFVAESGVRDSDDIRRLRQTGVDAVLIGEALMRNPDKKALLDEFRRAGSEPAPANGV